MNLLLKKITLFPLLLIVACLLCGVYGALHDQVSYTVSPEYYHAFKFRQFEIPPSLQNRVGASVVGWLASWWMGVFIGVPVLLIGLIMPNVKLYLSRCLIAFGIVMGTAIVVGGIALVYCYMTITKSTLPAYFYPDAVPDKAAFARAGTMHNFAYLGGFLGILTAAYLIVERFRLRKNRD